MFSPCAVNDIYSTIGGIIRQGVCMYGVSAIDGSSITIDTGYLDCRRDHIQLVLSEDISEQCWLDFEIASEENLPSTEEIEKILDMYRIKGYFSVELVGQETIRTKTSCLDLLDDVCIMTQIAIALHHKIRELHEAS